MRSSRISTRRPSERPERSSISLPLADTPDGVVITVRAMPRAGRSRIDGMRDGALLVRLAAAPVDGEANAELIVVLARALGVPRSRLTVIAGERSRDKRVLVSGVLRDAVERALSAILDQ
jgi:uncharacterized protein (TIGR00251 family)